MSTLSGAIVGGVVLDLLVGELPNDLHPVALFGRIIAAVDRDWNRPRIAGTLFAAVLPIAAAALIGFIVVIASQYSTVIGLGVGACAVFVTTSLKALLTNVRRVDEQIDQDLDKARRDLQTLAGRDAGELDAGGIRSAALESLAENLADGLVGPLFYFTVVAVFTGTLGVNPELRLGLAVAAAVWIKAINTLDSMWGYPDRMFGTAAARLDDIVMWIPARVTAVVLALTVVDFGALQRTYQWKNDVASPNAGWPMGVLAAGLDVRLEKPGHYVLNPTGDYPTPKHVSIALRRAGIAGIGSYALAGVIVWS